IGSLAAGFHYLFIRVKNTLGKWSHYEGRLFYVIEPGTPVANQPSLIKGEYFFDTDPGFGSGTPFSYATTDSVNMAININATGLPNGVHYVYLRVKNNLGKWSHYEGRKFEVCGSLIAGVSQITSDVGVLTICEGQYQNYRANVTNGGTTPEYLWTLNGNSVSTVDTYSPTSTIQTGDKLRLFVTSSQSCVSPSPMRDSLTIQVIDTVFSNQTASFCSNSFYTLPDGQTVSAAGSYTSFLSASNACDSVVFTTLSVTQPITIAASTSICTGSTYQFGSQTLTSGGQYVETFQAASGCDSTVTLTLTVSNTITVTANDTFCTGQTFTLPDGSTTTTGGTFSFQYTTTTGCDSTYTVELFEDICTGFASSKERAITLHPNPTTGLLHINGISTDATVTVTDAMGRRVWIGKTQNSTLNLEALDAGIYTLQIEQAQGVSQQKLVLNK
ncbi:MAG: T9SS C-terminal target domain-containing protein, partial [Chitinophagia bacterium]|nr:T9SS C-terminal target domain-containing protein [Chitinophagia bacterium]